MATATNHSREGARLIYIIVLLRENMFLSRRRYRILNKRRSRGKSLRRLMLAALLIVFGLGYKEIKSQLEHPQAILVLGGLAEREKFAAQFARRYPDLPIWISGGSPKGYAERVFTKAEIDLSRLHFDYRAVDTVTNFTTLVDELQTRGIKSVYLITSDYHMRRAHIIGEIVLGSRGIDFKPLPVPSKRSPEPIEKALRDGARAVLWVATGHTGSTLFRSQGSR